MYAVYHCPLGPLVKSGVAVIRVSGSNAFDAIKQMSPALNKVISAAEGVANALHSIGIDPAVFAVIAVGIGLFGR